MVNEARRVSVRCCRRWLPLVLLLCLVASRAEAQDATGTIRGSVRDESGGVLDGARLTVVHLETGLQRAAVSGDDGGFVVPLLPAGPYKVTVLRDGFAPGEVSPVAVVAGDPVVITIQLKIDSVGESVVVTAQKRAEPAQKVPISITALQGERLDQSSTESLREALNTVPGVVIAANQNDSAQISIRGVSAFSARNGGAGTAAYYLDTIPFGSVKTAIVPDTGAYDLERVEVLRGPQGTLYGANALNGVVRVLPREADLDRLEVKSRALTSVTRGGGANYRGDVALNVPLVPQKLAIRLVAGYQDYSGWIDRPEHDNANDGRIGTLRVGMKARPTERLSIGFLGWSSRIAHDANALADDDMRNPVRTDESNYDDFDAYSVKVAHDSRSVSLSSSTSYLSASYGNWLDLTPLGTPATQVTDTEADVFAQEVLLKSSGTRRWTWSAGAMYRHARDRGVQRYPELSPMPNGDARNASSSIAVFGEVTRSLFGGGAAMTGGLRYFHDRVRVDDLLAGNTNTSKQSNFSRVSPRVVLTWFPGADTTVYASYSEGFRSGAQQSPVVATLGVPATEPDSLRNYEVGAKGARLGGRLHFDTALYYIDWRDVQQIRNQFATLPNGLSTTVGGLFNSGSASGVGVDVGVALEPIDRLSLRGTLSWNGLRLDQDVFSQGALYANKGDRLTRSPEMTAGASAQYVFRLGHSALQGRAQASADYVSEQIAIPLTTTGISDPIVLSRISFAVSAVSGWSVTAFVDNLGDEGGKAYASQYGIAFWHSRLRPRTFGLQIDYRF